PRLDSSIFLISNARASGLMDTGERYTGTYAAAVENDAIIGVVAQFWNGNLLCQAPLDLLDDLWRAAVDASGRAVRGVVGPAPQVAAIRAGLNIPEERVQMDESEGLFSLALSKLSEPEPLRTGAVQGRRMEQRDLNLLAAWRAEYNMEALGAADSPTLREECRATMERSLREGTTWVLESNGHPVASTSFNARIAEAVQVGGVWTPPELRRRGYARAAVAASLLDARAEGVEKAILFTGQDHIAAQTAYRALGFQLIGDYRLLLFTA
ncbi:MAG: GNAT family N-acetyltransferase, partial [Caldilineaceae bacterium]